MGFTLNLWQKQVEIPIFAAIAILLKQLV